MKLVRTILSVPAQIWNWLQFKLFVVSFTEYPTIRGKLMIGGRGHLEIGSSVTINSSARSNPVGGQNRTSLHISADAKVVIGNNVGISNSLFYSRKLIVVEDDVMIGGACQIYDTDFHSLQYEDRIINGDKKVKTAPVIIKKGAFIGTSSIILKGVTIGEKSIIGAGLVVTKSVPPGEIWGGNPAKFIRKL